MPTLRLTYVSGPPEDYTIVFFFFFYRCALPVESGRHKDRWNPLQRQAPDDIIH
jgi:hypothetical protein